MTWKGVTIHQLHEDMWQHKCFVAFDCPACNSHWPQPEKSSEFFCISMSLILLLPIRWHYWKDHIGGLVHERRNSIANALELRLSWTNPSIYDSRSSTVDWSQQKMCGHWVTGLSITIARATIPHTGTDCRQTVLPIPLLYWHTDVTEQRQGDLGCGLWQWESAVW